MAIDIEMFQRTQAEFDVLPANEKLDKALYFIKDSGLIKQYDATTDSFIDYGGGNSSGAFNIDGGRSTEVYQQDDVIDGGNSGFSEATNNPQTI
jgi:hypothetical protein